MYKIAGKIVEVFDTVHQSDKYRNRIVVIKDESYTYPKEVALQASQDRVYVLDSFKKGDLVEIYFSVQTTKWKDKYFTSLNIERITKLN